MKADYLFRLDDASHYMNLSKWNEVEKIFKKNKIQPIVAVIPENRDESLMKQTFNPDFWNKVKHWDSKGWDIAMHGYQHSYHKINFNKSIVKFNNYSEFTGLSIDDQQDKISKSRKIFQKNGIDPSVWVAPGHSFDLNTLKALLSETKIKIISDGLSFSPYFQNGFHFIPQQLWSVKKKSFGTWTICLHPDSMTFKEIRDLEDRISAPEILNNITSLSKLELIKSNKNIFDCIYSCIFNFNFKCRRLLKKWLI